MSTHGCIACKVCGKCSLCGNCSCDKDVRITELEKENHLICEHNYELEKEIAWLKALDYSVKELETLASQLHDIYMTEARRQGDVRHPGGYESLAENIKEYDRVLARFILLRDKRTRNKTLDDAIETAIECLKGTTDEKYSDIPYFLGQMKDMS